MNLDRITGPEFRQLFDLGIGDIFYNGHWFMKYES
jgi:hypothetical protein